MQGLTLKRNKLTGWAGLGLSVTITVRFLSWKYLNFKGSKKAKNILKLDFCKDTPIEPQKRVVRLVWPNFGTPGFGATFYAKKCCFWLFSPTSSVPNFIKTHSYFKNGNIYRPKKFWEIWCRESVKKWPKIAFFGPKTAIFCHFCMLGSIKLLEVVNIDIFE